MASDTSTLRKREVSAMLKHGFLSDPSLSLSPSHPHRAPLPNSPSPPPSFPHPLKAARSPTLFEMMVQEGLPAPPVPDSDPDQARRLLALVDKAVADSPFAGAAGAPDVSLAVCSKDGFKVPMRVHRRVLTSRSRFFAGKLGVDDDEEAGARQHNVEICDCEDVEVYVEVVVLMYCEDLKQKLSGDDVARVLALLKVSAEILFDAGVMACLEYLEAVPWTEDEEERVVSVLEELQLEDPATEVLQRITVEPSTPPKVDAIYFHLFTCVLQAKDDRARREMKRLITGLLKEDSTQSRNKNNKLDVSNDTLYLLCNKCLNSLLLCLSEAANSQDSGRDRGALMAEISREADNIQWIVDIMIEKKMGDEFVKLWADQKELASLHAKIPSMYRYEISRITAQICVAVGRGQILVSKDARLALLNSWLEALYEDFGWMKRACKSLDKKMVEDGLSQTILTLPMPQQQAILLNWFDRFLSKGDDCPNIQRAFEVWWRRAFIRQFSGDQDRSEMQIIVCDYPT